MEQVGDKTFLSTLDELVDPSRTALIVSDPLVWILRDYGAAEMIQETSPWLWGNWERLRRGARECGVPVIFTQHYYDWDKITGPWLRYMYATRTLEFLRGMPFVHGKPDPDPNEFVPEMRPTADDTIILKMYHDAWNAETGLADVLRDRNVETIVLSGIATAVDLAGTGRRALVEGFYAVVVEDCCTQQELDVAAIRYLRSEIDVASTDEVLAVWSASR
jgi:nicotinamidase-related amidase